MIKNFKTMCGAMLISLVGFGAPVFAADEPEVPIEHDPGETAQECIQRVNQDFVATIQKIQSSGLSNQDKQKARQEAIMWHVAELAFCNALD